MQSADTPWIGGGGGFIRFTNNGGATWTFQQHRIHGPITGFFGFNQFAWAANSSNKVVIYSTDRGNFWRFPNAATFVRGWVRQAVVRRPGARQLLRTQPRLQEHDLRGARRQRCT